MEFVALNLNKRDDTLLNIIVILLFLLINPIYALLICFFLNLLSSKINYWIFSFMFALSFSLLFFLKDYSWMEAWTDTSAYIYEFQTINDVSWSELLYRFVESPNGNEPFFWTYIKITNILFFGNAAIFLFFHFFLTFLMIAYIGKLSGGKKFVIIIACLWFLSPLMLSLSTQLRNITGFLILYTGIFLFDIRERKWLPRIIIYSAGLFHISIIPLIILHECFILLTKGTYKFEYNRLFSKEIIGYMAIPILAYIVVNENFLHIILQPFGLTGALTTYYGKLITKIPYSNIIFNWVVYLILLSVWVRRKKLSNVDVYITFQYFLFIFLLMELALPSAFMRIFNFVSIGGTLIIGRLAVFNSRFGFMLLMLMFSRYYYKINFDTGAILHYSERLFAEWMNPFYGLGRMILNYDTLLYFNY